MKEIQNIIADKDKIKIEYKDNTSYSITTTELISNPISRIPLFNILKMKEGEDGGWKALIKDWLEFVLGWKVWLKEDGEEINPEEERTLWKKKKTISPVTSDKIYPAPAYIPYPLKV